MTYREVAPSGVKVTSTRPLLDVRWQDHPVLHPIWSYASWLSVVLKHGFGIEAPRRWFNRHWNTRPPAP